MQNNNSFRQIVLIVFVGALLYLPFLGSVHLFDWDEINFAESAREMIVTGDYNTVQINFKPFWEKPPIFIWLQALSMKVFGINEYAARFPNAICGILTLLILYLIGKQLYNACFGLIWAAVYACSVLPFLYFKSGIIDPWFNLFIFSGVYFLFRFANRVAGDDGHRFILLSAASIGLGILTKGPVALLIWGLTAFIYWVWHKFRFPIRFIHVIEFSVALVLVGGSWFFWQLATGNAQIIVDFIEYQIRLFQTEDAGHGGFLLYHFVILFLGVFPASIFSIGFYRRVLFDLPVQQDFKQWMGILFWAVLILFTIVSTKIIHYSSLCYFPLTFMGAYTVYYIFENEMVFSRLMQRLLSIVAFFYAFAIVFVSCLEYLKPCITDKLLKDPFALANLQAQVNWSGFEILIGIIPLAAIWLTGRFFKQQHYKSVIISWVLSTVLFTYLAVIFITPRIEGYSQRAIIEFYKSKQNEDCIIILSGFKSYAHLFYAQKQPSVNNSDINYLTRPFKKSEKPVYLVTKINKRKGFLKKYPEWGEQVFEKNGFVVFKKIN